MEEIKSAIIEKAKLFLEARKYSDNLTEIFDDLDVSCYLFFKFYSAIYNFPTLMVYLQKYQCTYEAILALEMIFTETLKNRTMLASGASATSKNRLQEHSPIV